MKKKNYNRKNNYKVAEQHQSRIRTNQQKKLNNSKRKLIKMEKRKIIEMVVITEKKKEMKRNSLQKNGKWPSKNAQNMMVKILNRDF